jgi:hypothetical protein
MPLQPCPALWRIGHARGCYESIFPKVIRIPDETAMIPNTFLLSVDSPHFVHNKQSTEYFVQFIENSSYLEQE